MGIDIHGARFLCYAKTLGVDLAQTATIGRQGLFSRRRDISLRRDLKSMLESFGYEVDDEQIESIFNQTDGYAEHLLTYLGAKEVHSIDYSAYEGATHLHDMNRELPERFKEQYSAVLDGGSLEHIFNFPMAIKNCMEMVRIGGHYLAITPANNFFGHGFYQFSPELYFTVFSRENGFEVTSLIAFEDRPKSIWYSVKSPREVGGRVTLSNSIPVFLLVVARKFARSSIFETTPQQSDYVPLWHEKSASSESAHGSVPPPPAEKRVFVKNAKRMVPATIKKLVRAVIKRRKSKVVGFDPSFFLPLDPTPSGHRRARGSD
jgi:hypothetical protein